MFRSLSGASVGQSFSDVSAIHGASPQRFPAPHSTAPHSASHSNLSSVSNPSLRRHLEHKAQPSFKVLASSIDGYGSVQGGGGWHYGFYPMSFSSFAPFDFELFPAFTTDDKWAPTQLRRSNDAYLSEAGGKPTATMAVVRRWQNLTGVQRRVRIALSIRRLPRSAHGAPVTGDRERAQRTLRGQAPGIEDPTEVGDENAGLGVSGAASRGAARVEAILSRTKAVARNGNPSGLASVKTIIAEVTAGTSGGRPSSALISVTKSRPRNARRPVGSGAEFVPRVLACLLVDGEIVFSEEIDRSDEDGAEAEVWCWAFPGSEIDFALFSLSDTVGDLEAYALTAKITQHDNIQAVEAQIRSLIERAKTASEFADGIEVMPTVFDLKQVLKQCALAGLADRALDTFEALCEIAGPGRFAMTEVYELLVEICAKHDRVPVALTLLADMDSAGMLASVRTYNSVIRGCCAAKDVLTARTFLGEMIARRIPRNGVTYALLIGAYARDNAVEEAVRLYKDMRTEGILPSYGSLAPIAVACARRGELEVALEWVDDMRREMIGLTGTVYDALVACACGRFTPQGVSVALSLSQQMVQRDKLPLTIGVTRAIVEAAAECKMLDVAREAVVAAENQGLIVPQDVYDHLVVGRLRATGKPGLRERPSNNADLWLVEEPDRFFD